MRGGGDAVSGVFRNAYGSDRHGDVSFIACQANLTEPPAATFAT